MIASHMTCTNNEVFLSLQYQVLFPALWSVIEQIQASKVHNISG